MKKLSEPDITSAIELLNNAINRKKNIVYGTRLQAKQAYISARYIIYQTNKSTLEHVTHSNITNDVDKKAIHTSFTSSFEKNIKNNSLKLVYEECRGYCPSCGIEKLEEVDHYMPKEHYPEFTLFPLNLIPICPKCNRKKSDKFLDGNGKRMFINFYTDDMDNLDFLNVNIIFDPSDVKRTTTVKYTTDFAKIDDSYLRQIVAHHYDELNLIERYEDAAIDEISSLESIYSNYMDENKEADENEVKKAAQITVSGTENMRLKQIGNNDWKYLLFKKLLEIKYIDALIIELFQNNSKY